MGDTMREAFERWAHGGSRGWDITLCGDVYDDRSVQIAWVAWQAAHEAGRQLGMEQARREPLTLTRVIHIATRIWPAEERQRVVRVEEFARAIEAAHGIHTPPAGDSDTKERR